MLQIKRIIKNKLLLLLFITIISLQILLNFSPMVIVKCEDSNFQFSSFNDITSINYQMNQELYHWDEGNFNGEGNISINLDHQVNERVYLDINYNITIWQKPCASSVVMNESVYLSINTSSREVIGVSDEFFAVNQMGYHLSWFLEQNSNPNDIFDFYFEELMFIHGLKYEKYFENKGDSYLFLDGVRTPCKLFQWEGQLIYAGYICSLGWNPIFNCSVNYFYEKETGIMLYSEASIMEYIGDEPEIFQKHKISRILSDINGNIIDVNDEEGPSSEQEPDNWFSQFENPGEVKAFIIIGSIIISGILSILIINRLSKSKRIANLLEFEKEFDSKSEK